jgi:raffinose/stachyose/melibiose transport system permease protein
MITNIILTAINVWNNFMIPLFYLGRASKWPVTLTIYNFFSQYVRDWQYVFAALTLTVMPMIILFLALQKYIVGGMTNGAVKG